MIFFYGFMIIYNHLKASPWMAALSLNKSSVPNWKFLNIFSFRLLRLIKFIIVQNFTLLSKTENLERETKSFCVNWKMFKSTIWLFFFSQSLDLKIGLLLVLIFSVNLFPYNVQVLPSYVTYKYFRYARESD